MIHSAKAVRKRSRTGAIGSSLAGPGARAKPIVRPAPSAMTQALVEKPPRERPSASRWSRSAEAPPFWPHQRPFDGPGWWCRRGTPFPAVVGSPDDRLDGAAEIAVLGFVGRAARLDQRCQLSPLGICQNAITSFICHGRNIGIELKG